MSRELKIAAARAAIALVQPGMRLGIGTGSTADEFILLLGERVRGQGLSVIGVPTSERSAKLCASEGIPLATLEELPQLDLTIDGADEIDPKLNLIKGAGGALLREKIVAAASAEMVVIADDSKLVDELGAFKLPVEVNRFGLGATRIAVQKVAGALNLPEEISIREHDGQPFVTDGGHLILDASFGRIRDARALSTLLLEVPGVVQHGLFLEMATRAFVAGEAGVREISA